MAQNDSSLKEYLREIARYPLLSPEQEIQLGRQVVRMQQPDCTDREQRQGRRARDKFIQSNLKLVVNIAKKYDGRQRKAMMLMDLIQEGNIGLARAVDMFDPSRGYRFTTYAYWWIKQAIHRAIANNDNMIRIPSSLHEKIIKIVKVQTMLMQQLGRLPSQREIADELGITIDEMVTAIQRNQSTSSLDATGAELDRSAIIDFIADGPQLIKCIVEDYVLAPPFYIIGGENYYMYTPLQLGGTIYSDPNGQTISLINDGNYVTQINGYQIISVFNSVITGIVNFNNLLPCH